MLMSERNPNDQSVIGDLLTSHAAVKMLPGVSYAQLMRWAREGTVPSVQYVPRGPRWFRRSDISALLARQVGHLGAVDGAVESGSVPGKGGAEGPATLPGLGKAGR